MTNAQAWRSRIVGYDQVDPRQLVANPKNWRTHPDAQRGALEGVLGEVGWVAEVLVNRRTGFVVDGHLRVASAVAHNEPSVPVRYVDLDDAEERLVLATLDPISALASSDSGQLSALLDGLQPADQAVANLLRDMVPLAQSPVLNPDDADLTPPEKPISQPGDLWLLGEHRLLCGDARSPDDVARVVPAAVNLALTSPPYAEQREYDTDTEFVRVPPVEYVAWFAPVSANVQSHLAGDGSWLINIKPSASQYDTDLYVFDLVLAHVRNWGWHFATEFCWERAGVPKEPTLRLKNQFEPVYQFVRGGWKFRPRNVMHESDSMIIPVGPGGGNTSWEGRQGTISAILPGQHRRARRNGTSGTMSDVQGTNAAPVQALQDGWAYPGNRLPTFAGTHEALGHPAAYPVGLADFFVRLFTDESDVVFDPFAGSGSTLIASEQTRRRCAAIEISPAYCDVIVRRWERVTGGQAHKAHA